MNESPGGRPGQPLRFPVNGWERDAAGNAGRAIAVLGLSSAEVLGLTPEIAGWSVRLAVSGARERCERREKGECQQGHQQPAKARAARGAREQDRGGGWAWRAGTRSGYGRPGGPGISCGAGVDRGAGALPSRIPHYAKSIFKHLLMGYRAVVPQSFISPYSVGDRR